MYENKKLWIGMSGTDKVVIEPSMANRHGLIAGATGTGKTTTLRVMAESFSDAGVPVFLADVKGDLAAMCRPGREEGFVAARIEEYGLKDQGFSVHGCPTAYWDVYAEKGMPLRTTVSEMGPLLLSRVLGLNNTQEEVLTVIFKIADDNDMLLIDTKDLRAMLTYVGDNAKELSLKYGNMSKQSLASIIRAVIALETEGGEKFFAEPALNIADWIRCNADGKGYINILECEKLIMNPTMYGTFLLWMLSELYETLPEVGDMEKPRLVFFFDEAHLLFSNASKELAEKIEQVVKLIRSKGVGIYFITQSPSDVPNGVLAQLSNKVQHALHAYTPAEQKSIKAAADSFRANPEFNTAEILQNLGIGEAIVSVLDESGVPTVAQKTIILPPQCSMDTLSNEDRDNLIKQSDLYLKYNESIDRDSAYEFLERKAVADAEALEKAKAEMEAQKQAEKDAIAAQKQAEKEAAAAQKAAEKAELAKKKQATKVVKNVASSAGTTIGREVGQTIGNAVGGSFGKKLGGNLGASIGRGILGSIISGK